jgi:hypothetical protein
MEREREREYDALWERERDRDCDRRRVGDREPDLDREFDVEEGYRRLLSSLSSVKFLSPLLLRDRLLGGPRRMERLWSGSELCGAP